MKNSILILMLMMGFLSFTSASNPVTTTDFHSTFSYLEEVQHVQDHGLIDGRIIPFLLDQNIALDEKAAVINALTTNNKTNSNALTFKQFVARKYKQQWENLDLNSLTADELFCLGYMTILDEKGNAENGIPMFEMAAQKNPTSYTIQLFLALASAEQSIRKGNSCEGWNTFNAVKSNVNLDKDLDAGIEKALTDAMTAYSNGCE